jgi:hypothetical protein
MCHLEYEPLRSPHKITVSPSSCPLHPLISPKLSHSTCGNPTPARRLPAPRDAERPRRPRGDAGPGSQRQSSPAAVQDPLYHWHPFRHPRPIGLQLRTILEEPQHSILNVEHQTNERARVTAGCITLALKLASARCLRSR